MPSFFTAGFGAWLALALLLIGGAGLAIEEWRISDIRSELKMSQDDLALSQANLAIAHANLATLSGAIDQQNDALKAAQDQATAASAALEYQIKLALAAHRATVLPPGSGPTIMNMWFKHEYGAPDAR